MQRSKNREEKGNVNIRCSNCGTHSTIPSYSPKDKIPKCPKCGKNAYRI